MTNNDLKAFFADRPALIRKVIADEARHYAINFMDHSKETIVRECSKLTDYTHIYENIPVN